MNPAVFLSLPDLRCSLLLLEVRLDRAGLELVVFASGSKTGGGEDEESASSRVAKLEPLSCLPKGLEDVCNLYQDAKVEAEHSYSLFNSLSLNVLLPPVSEDEITWVFTPVTTEITSLDTENIDDILRNADVALVNFYADWCRFSQMLHPIFEEASNVIKEEYPSENQVVFARVDCDQHSDIAQRYRISKYPTLKLFRNGMMMKREYRGQRSVKALADYIRQQKSDPVQELHDLVEITTLDRSKRNIIGYFEQKDSEHYRVFQRVANILHDDCAFFSALGDVSKPERYSGDSIIYKPPGPSAPDMVYLGSMTNFDGIYNWIQDKCVPLVREITFENGEELTEEGLPFLILFHMKEDTESLEIFQNEVARQLISEKGAINFLHADCDKFRHPLLHIQKTPADCPVIAIDSFRHMYVFENFKDILTPGRLKQFVLDLHSGKLHREFHHGPDPTDTAQGQDGQDVASSPPESSFQKLAPSEYRYTLLRDRDEL